MAKDHRPMPKELSDEEIWRWVIGDESPLVVESEFRDRGVVTNQEAANELLEVRGWLLLSGLLRIPQGRFNRYMLSVVVSAVGESRTQVVIQGTQRTGEIRARVESALTQEFGGTN